MGVLVGAGVGGTAVGVKVGTRITVVGDDGAAVAGSTAVSVGNAAGEGGAGVGGTGMGVNVGKGVAEGGTGVGGGGVGVKVTVAVAVGGTGVMVGVSVSGIMAKAICWRKVVNSPGDAWPVPGSDRVDMINACNRMVVKIRPKATKISKTYGRFSLRDFIGFPVE